MTNKVEENGDNDSIRDGDTERGSIIGVTWWGGRGRGGGTENKHERVRKTDNKTKKTSFKHSKS